MAARGVQRRAEPCTPSALDLGVLRPTQCNPLYGPCALATRHVCHDAMPWPAVGVCRWFGPGPGRNGRALLTRLTPGRRGFVGSPAACQRASRRTRCAPILT